MAHFMLELLGPVREQTIKYLVRSINESDIHVVVRFFGDLC